MATKKPVKIPLLYVRQDLGSGRPIIMLHGMFADGTQWRVMANMLAKYYRVIVVDLLGHGKSPRPKGAKYTPHEHSIALRKTLEKIGATGDATVVGYSMGGTVALQYAADYHDVAQLYMISTPFYLHADDMVAAGYANSLFYTKVSVGLFRQVDKMLRPGKMLHKLVKNDDIMKWLHVLIDAYDNQLDPTIMRKNLDRLINNYPFASNLAQVTAPITFFSGKRDAFVVQGQLPALRKIQPLMEIESLGIVKNDHMLVQYLPKKMVDILKRYSQQVLHVGVDVGEGEVIVLLHGIESSSSYWSNIIPNLSSNYRVVTLDLLGFGKSVKPMNIAYSLDDQVKWVHRTLGSMGVEKFRLVGHSLGALVSLAYSAAYTDQVKSLTLISPVFFDESNSAKRFLIKKLKFIDYFSDTSYLATTVSRAVGARRLRAFVPMIRSIDNAVKKQNSVALAAKARKIPTTLLYGEKDVLVDRLQLQAVAKKLRDVDVVPLRGAGHNFPLTDPQTMLENSGLRYAKQPKPKRSTLKPHRVLRQIVRLAVPILFLRGALFLVVGLLLFSKYNKETLVIAVAVVVIYQSIEFIRGSFSLKNEGLSYLGYMSVGIFGIALGYALTNHFKFSLKVALIAVCGLILVNGLARLLAAALWTTNKRVRRTQLLTGLALTLISGAAFLGSTVSVYAIVFTIGVYLIVRGLTYGFYAVLSLFTAFVRGF